MPPQDMIDSPFGNGPNALTTPAVNPAQAPAAPPARSVSLPGMDVLGTIIPSAGAEEIDYTQGLDQTINNHISGMGSIAAPARQFNEPNSDLPPPSLVQVFERAQNDQEKAQILSQWVGPGNFLTPAEGNGQWYFRKPGQTGFNNLETSWSDAFKSAKGIENLASQYPNALQGGAAAVAGTIGGRVGGVPGAMLGGMLGAFGAGQLREDAFDELIKNKNEQRGSDEVAKDVLSQAVGEGFVNLGAVALKSSLKKIKNLIMDFSNTGTELERAKISFEMAKNLDSLGKAFGSESTDMTGKYLLEGYDKTLKNMGEKYIGKYNNMVQDIATNRKAMVPVDDILASLRDQLKQNAGVKFDGDAVISVPRGTKLPDMTGMSSSEPQGETVFEQMMGLLPKGQQKQIRSEMGIESSLGAKVNQIFSGELPGTAYPFGSDRGHAVTNDLLNDYNSLLQQKIRNGGISYEEFRRLDQVYGDRGDYNNQSMFNDHFKGGRARSALRQVEHSINDTKKKFDLAMLEGSPAQKSYLNDHSQYQSMKDTADDLKNTFKTDDVAGYTIVNKALSTDNPTMIKNIKYLFLDHPEAMDKLKGSVFQKALEENIMGDTGHINMKGVAKSLSSYSPRVMEELFTDVERRQIQGFVRGFDKVITSDFGPIEAGSKAATNLEQMANLAFSVMKSPVKAAYYLFNMTSKREEALDFLLKNRLPTMLKEANNMSSLDRAGKISTIMDILTNYKALSDSIKVGERNVVVPSQSLKTLWLKMGLSGAAAKPIKESEPVRRAFPSPTPMPARR
jgi:hypothetical protein